MTRHIAIRALLVTLLSLSWALQAVVSHAGFTDALKKKITDKVTQKAEGSVDKTTAKGQDATDGDKKKAAADEGETAGSFDGGSGKVSGVSTKFDFVPGDSVVFVDFTQDELGEFPARWKLHSGTFEVAELEGERWLRCVSNDGHIRMKVPPSLPEFWTLEFDGNRLDAAGNTLTVSALSSSGSTVWETTFPFSGRNVMFRSGQIFSDRALPPAGRDSWKDRERTDRPGLAER